MSTTSPQRLDFLWRDAAARIDADDARCLLAHAAGQTPAWLYAHGDEPADAALAERFSSLVERRLAGEPVAYLTGRRGFWSFELDVTADTLIPRPETERLVELALERLPQTGDLRLADLGTGSGAIALALARERPQARVVATDRSDAALAVASRNADALGLTNVEFRSGDWCAPLATERFHLIASNPPYIADDDPHLRQGDLRFEPTTALTPGGDGLDAIRQIVAQAGDHLLPGGWLLLEHGHDQGDAVRDVLAASGFVEVGTAQDLEQRDRVSMGRWRADACG